MALPSTVINGIHYDPSSYEIRVDSTALSPYVKALTYGDKLTPTFGYGESPQPLLRSRGVYDPGTVSLELYKFAAEKFEAYLAGKAAASGGNGHGICEVNFTILITIAETGFDTITDTLQVCRLISPGNEMPSAGASDLSSVKYEIQPAQILHNGRCLFKGPRV